MNFNNSETKKNLAKSYAAECQAGARYQFMATMAQNEGLFYIKDIMKLIAKNEMAHAKLFYDYIVDNCKDNCMAKFEADYPYVNSSLDVSLKKEAEIEQQEFDTIYPTFAEIAKNEGFDDIANSFLEVAKVEQTHAEILKFLNTGYRSQTLYKSKTKRLLKCSNCGYIDCKTEGWKKCPLCSLTEGYIAIDYSSVFQNLLEEC